MRPDSAEDDEALGSMLIAWYMSGYHTGYYLVCAALECLGNFALLSVLLFAARSHKGRAAYSDLQLLCLRVFSIV